MYVIFEGKVKIFKRVGKKEKTLAILKKGEFFGEIAALVNQRRTASAMAITDCTLLVVDPASFRVRRSIVFDPLGNRNEYHFTELKFGSKIADSKFDFEIPKGASILRSTMTTD